MGLQAFEIFATRYIVLNLTKHSIIVHNSAVQLMSRAFGSC